MRESTIGRLAAAVLSVSAGLAGAGLATADGAERPPVVIVSIDTLRSDHLPAYGYTSIRTPAIDSLAREGLVVERAYTTSPLTLPAHASLLTGTLPTNHGVRDNLGYRLRPPLPLTLAERLRVAGYRCLASVSAVVLRGETGLARGFEHYDDDLDASGAGRQSSDTLGEVQRSGEATLDALLSELEASDDPRPPFVFLHLYEPHAPYASPGEVPPGIAPYDAEIVEADRIIGRLLAELRRLELYDRALVIVVSDHGEGLGEHGEAEHGIFLNREVLQVPMVLKLPGGSRAGQRLEEPASLVDVVPTVLEIVGASKEEGLDGISLLSPRRDPAPRSLYSETFYPRLRFGWSEFFSIVRGRHHYIHGPRPELYDLVDDPGERRNLQTDERPTVWALRSELAALRRPLVPPFAESEATRTQLASLGYLSSTSTSDDEARPDPKDRLEQLEGFEYALAAVRSGDLTSAARALTTLVAASPAMLEAWQFLGLVRDSQGDLEAALEAYRRAYELSNGAPALGKQLARTLVRLDNHADARVIAEHSRALAPEDLELALIEGEILLATERFALAEATAAEAVRLAPRDSAALYLRARVAIARGQLSSAERDLRRALDLAPQNRDVRSELAILLSSQGRLTESEEVLTGSG